MPTLEADTDPSLKTLVTGPDVEEYRDRGYWISPKLFTDDEISSLRDEVKRVMNSERDYPNFGWQGDRKNDISGHRLGQFTNAWWVNRAIRRAVTKPSLGYIGAQLMDTPEVRIWHDQAVWKPAAGAGGKKETAGNVGWHQDYAHWQCSNTTNMCTAWIALQDTDLQNGGMRTIVGSHKWGLVEDSYTFSEKDLDGLRARYERADREWIDEPCILKAGQASFHHALTFHGSGPNLTDTPRVSLIVHMMPQGCGLRPNAPQWHLTATLLGPYARPNQPFEGPFFPRIWPPAGADRESPTPAATRSP